MYASVILSLLLYLPDWFSTSNDDDDVIKTPTDIPSQSQLRLSNIFAFLDWAHDARQTTLIRNWSSVIITKRAMLGEWWLHIQTKQRPSFARV